MRIYSLAIYRFIASFFLVFFHYGRSTALAQSVFFIGTVIFFFVLSGYVLTLGYISKEIVFLKYFKARIYRIAPVYYLALFMAALLQAEPISKRAFLFSLFFLQAWFPPSPNMINGQAWYVSALMSLYLLFPLILLIIKKTKPRAQNLILYALLLWAFSLSISTNLLNSRFYKPYPSISHDLIFYFPLVHLASFFLGIAGAYYYLSIKERKFSPLLIRTGFILSILGTLAVLNNSNWFSNIFGLSLPISAGLFAPLFLVLILFSSLSEKISTPEWLKHRLFNFLSDLSYPIYILQLPLYYVYMRYLQPLLEIEAKNIFYVYFLCLFVFSIIINKYFEKPFTRLLAGKNK